LHSLTKISEFGWTATSQNWSRFHIWQNVTTICKLMWINFRTTYVVRQRHQCKVEQSLASCSREASFKTFAQRINLLNSCTDNRTMMVP
jgi:hypothetical protein